jgi:hypothetical protein
MDQLDIEALNQRTDAVCDVLGPNEDQDRRSGDDCSFQGVPRLVLP